MTDMICRQQKCTCAIRILAPQYANPRDTAKQQLHKDCCCAIRKRVKKNPHALIIAQPFKAGKANAIGKSPARDGRTLLSSLPGLSPFCFLAQR